MSSGLTSISEFDMELAREMSEATLQERAEQLLRVHRWRWHHAKTSQVRGRYMTAQTGQKGLPDIIAIRAGSPSRLLFIELKMEGKYLEPEQREWRDGIEACQEEQTTVPRFPGDIIRRFMLPEYYLWRPSDLISGLILETLR